ncbi:MAG: M48 family metalloprotease [Acidobacteria bacterium]|nr:M48 family metalloprotease [Acidobacteriota bacterium]
MNIDRALERKLTRARTQLLLSQPFFGALCLRLKLESGALPMMATDGRRIMYNPGFVEALKPAELEAVFAHEVLHCALGHHCRRGERDAQLWNQAADLAINPILVANGFTLPSGALLDSALENLSAEEIYARLSRPGDPDPAAAQPPPSSSANTTENSRQQQPNNCAPGSANERAGNGATPQEGAQTGTSSPQAAGCGEVLDAVDELGHSATQAEKSRQQQEWSIAADQAMRAAKACGHEPASLKRQLEESRESQQDWRAILQDFITAQEPSDYRWSPPNRRYIASGLYLPSVERTGVGTIVIAVDTSGSIAAKELEQFAGEISAICEQAQPEAVHVVYCDAAVQGSQEFQRCDAIQLEAKGGGGTDFRPVFEWVEQKHLEPVCLIYLTDLCCHSYPEPPEYPVLWVTSSRRQAAFGETLRITVE